MKTINDILCVLVAAIVAAGPWSFISQNRLPNQSTSDFRFLENCTVNAIQLPVRTSSYQPDVKLLSNQIIISCLKSVPVEQYSKLVQTFRTSPLPAFKFALGLFSADY